MCESKLVYLLLCMYLGVFVCVLGPAEGQAHIFLELSPDRCHPGSKHTTHRFFYLWKWVQCVGSRSALVMLPECHHDNSGHPSRA